MLYLVNDIPTTNTKEKKLHEVSNMYTKGKSGNGIAISKNVVNEENIVINDNIFKDMTIDNTYVDDIGTYSNNSDIQDTMIDYHNLDNDISHDDMITNANNSTFMTSNDNISVKILHAIDIVVNIKDIDIIIFFEK